MKTELKFLLLPALFYNFYSFSQIAYHNAGGDVENTTGSMSYTIGQVIPQTISNPDYQMEIGVQHGYLISTSGLSSEELFNNIAVYPNPFSDLVSIVLTQKESASYLYEVVDVKGSTAVRGEINELTNTIDLSFLINAVYFINLYSKDGEKLETIKIIKN